MYFAIFCFVRRSQAFKRKTDHNLQNSLHYITQEIVNCVRLFDISIDFLENLSKLLLAGISQENDFGF